MDISFIDRVISAAFLTTPELSQLADLLFKSFAIVLFIGLLILLLSKKLASSSKHLLWLTIYVCLALLPLLSVIARPIRMVGESVPALLTVGLDQAVGNSLTSYSATAIDMGGFFLIFYVLIAAIFLLKLAIAAWRTYQIGSRANDLIEKSIQQRLAISCKKLKILREVRLGCSAEISSPISFGLFKPQIILPETAKQWETEILDDVFIHELSHIKRLDWLSMIFAYLVTSFLWLNPLLWVALRKLNEEAENSCDSKVLQHGRSETRYAEHLLRIARSMQVEPRNQALAQMMLTKSMLPIRIHRLLENDMVNARTHRLFALPLLILTSALLVTCTGTRLMEVESSVRPAPSPARARGDILPISSIAPQYPLRAAYAGIEGWALTEFTVLENGDVDPDSIVVVDADPSDIFNRASIRAAEQFKFEPIAGHEAREVSGVQYVFRYQLGEPGEGEGSINRTLEPINSVTPDFPAQADSDGIAGGNVWTVFHVTRAGTVQDVMVRYSSNDIFNEPAIAAAQQLQFAPRSPGDGIESNVRGDTTGLVRAQYLFRFIR